MQVDIPVAISISVQNRMTITINKEKKFPEIFINDVNYTDYTMQFLSKSLDCLNTISEINNEHCTDDFHSNRTQGSDNEARLEQVERLMEEKFRLMHETEIKKKKEELEAKYDQINRQKIMDIESDFNKRKTDFELRVKEAIMKHSALESSMNDKVNIMFQSAMAEKEKEFTKIEQRFNKQISEAELKVKEAEMKYASLESSIDDKLYARFGEKERNYIIELERKDRDISLLKQSAESAAAIKSELNDMKNSFQSMFKSDKQSLGEAGETFIYSYIKEHLTFANAVIERVNGNSNACDIFMSYDNIQCGIESKNHSGMIRADNVKRFTTVDICNPRYNCGIFIALKSGFVSSTRIKHFDVQFYENKPVIFLEEIMKRPEHIIIAIKMLNMIVSSNSSKENEVRTIVSTVQSYISSLERIQRSNNQIIKLANESGKEIQTIMNSINDLLNVKQTEEQFFSQFISQTKLKDVLKKFREWSGDKDVTLKKVKQLAESYGLDIVKISSVYFCQVKK